MDKINNVFASSVFVWAYLYVLACSAFYVLLLFSPGRALSMCPVLTTVTLAYFFVSVFCELVKKRFEDIGQSLYSSKWYLLKPCCRKDFLMILMMGLKEKTLVVGPFGFAGLEKFGEV